MSLELNINLKARLVELLAAALPKINVNNKKYLNSIGRFNLFEANGALPDHGKLTERLLAYIDDFPFVTFAYDFIQGELFDSEDYDDESPSASLTSLKQFSDPLEAAKRIVDHFDTLPWKYTLSFKLPYEISKVLGEVIDDEQQLSSSLCLKKVSDGYAKSYPLNSANDKRQKFIHGTGTLLFPDNEKKEWPESAIYLQIKTEGYIGSFGGTAPALQAERSVKAFLGLGIALKLFDVSHTYFAAAPKEHFYVHRLEKEVWEIETKLDLNADLSRVINELKLNGIIVNAESEERRQRLLRLIFSEMAAVFSGGANAESIALASEWLLDSYSGRDSRLNYVQSMVVLEVLLGDKATSDLMGLGQLLRNRCAYLIGANKEERDTLLEDFDKIYKTRSQIVHRGKVRLNFKERVQFSNLQKICNRVIQKEVDLLRAK